MKDWQLLAYSKKTDNFYENDEGLSVQGEMKDWQLLAYSIGTDNFMKLVLWRDECPGMNKTLQGLTLFSIHSTDW